MILASKLKTTFVPCNGCTLCCQCDAIRLTEEDNPADYLTEQHPYILDALMLAHKPNGDCIYLVESGCSIHERAPSLCKSADCRSIALKYDFNTAMQLHQMKRIDIRVWDKGNDLLNDMRAKQKPDS
ncbi:MAG TPA: YkgJ family cysteine cluster protein [Ignavibacteriaceae bacterium]|nr:YkgJ family cysteine cluster protein [Ignavibacteriaceae bacterium]